MSDWDITDIVNILKFDPILVSNFGQFVDLFEIEADQKYPIFLKETLYDKIAATLHIFIAQNGSKATIELLQEKLLNLQWRNLAEKLQNFRNQPLELLLLTGVENARSISSLQNGNDDIISPKQFEYNLHLPERIQIRIEDVLVQSPENHSNDSQNNSEEAERLNDPINENPRLRLRQNPTPRKLKIFKNLLKNSLIFISVSLTVQYCVHKFSSSDSTSDAPTEFISPSLDGGNKVVSTSMENKESSITGKYILHDVNGLVDCNNTAIVNDIERVKYTHRHDVNLCYKKSVNLVVVVNEINCTSMPILPISDNIKCSDNVVILEVFVTEEDYKSFNFQKLFVGFKNIQAVYFISRNVCSKVIEYDVRNELKKLELSKVILVKFKNVYYCPALTSIVENNFVFPVLNSLILDCVTLVGDDYSNIKKIMSTSYCFRQISCLSPESCDEFNETSSYVKVSFSEKSCPVEG